MDQTELEIAIRDLLLSAKDPRQVTEGFIKRLQNESPTLLERQIFIRYLINAGQYQAAYKILGQWFLEKSRIPLYEFCYLLHKTGYQPGNEFQQHIEKAQQELPEENRLAYFQPWAELSPFWQNLNAAHTEKAQKSIADRRQSLFDRLEYFQVNRMIDEEERLLKQLQQEYPEEQEKLQAYANSFQERWARAIITRQALEQFDAALNLKTAELSPSEQKFVNLLLEEMNILLLRHPELAYDFALALCFMELYEPARQLLGRATPSKSVDWLYPDVLIKCRRYAEGLDVLLNLEMRYSDDPETTFAVTYYRALALQGLGQTGAAVELLRSLVAIRPSYRSAHSLLLQWGGRA